jgi:ABC-type glycerol-3-phosphate transport system permease component
MAAVTLSVLPLIAVYVFFQRFLVRGIAVGMD